ncbi:hypothetical protein R0381_002825 [Jeongeupia wiesaeckerbachi]|uniref:hypothetical protein n=1 Tax=Jeongeupia wiesaeckerbachi TaxID=3051218 RepID=UPI003D805024
MVLLVAVGAHATEVYKCPDGKGGVLYTQTKCPGGTPLSGGKGSFSVVPAPKLPPPTAKVEPPPLPTPVGAPERAASRRPDPDAPLTDNCNVDNPDYDPYFCTPGNLWTVYGQPYGPRPRPPYPRPPRPPHPPHKPVPSLVPQPLPQPVPQPITRPQR